MERYYQQEIETADREQILAWQNERLVKQVRHVWDNVPYYRAKMEAAGVTLEDIQGQCAILFTQKNLNANFGRKPKDTAAPVVADVFQQTPAAEVNSRYGVLPTKKD